MGGAWVPKTPWCQQINGKQGLRAMSGPGDCAWCGWWINGKGQQRQQSVMSWQGRMDPVSHPHSHTPPQASHNHPQHPHSHTQGMTLSKVSRASQCKNKEATNKLSSHPPNTPMHPHAHIPPRRHQGHDAVGHPVERCHGPRLPLLPRPRGESVSQSQQSKTINNKNNNSNNSNNNKTALPLIH